MAKGRIQKQNLNRLLSYERAAELLRYQPRSGALYWIASGERADKGGCPRYRRVTIDGVRFQAHRVIWLLQTKTWPSKGEVDHRDTNGHNNRWTNLRDANRYEQNLNTRGKQNSKAGLKWVRVKGPGRYQATVQLTLGTYSSPVRAHRAAREFVREHHGAFFNSGVSA